MSIFPLQMNERWLKHMKVLLGIVLLTVLLCSLDVNSVLHLFSVIQGSWLVITIICIYIIFGLQAVTLGLSTLAFANIPPVRLIVFTFIGRFFSLFLPSTVGGDVIKGLYLVPYFPIASQAYTSILVHRLIGMLSTFVVSIVTCALLLPGEFRVVPQIILFALVAAGIIGAFFWPVFKRFLNRTIAIKRRIPQQGRVDLVVRSLLVSVAAYRSRKLLLVVIFLVSSIETLAMAGVYVLLAKTLKVDLALSQALVAASATLLFIIIPLTPGGIGVSEGAFVVFCGIMGVEKEDAFAIAIFARFLGYVCTLPGGIIYLFMPVHKKLF